MHSAGESRTDVPHSAPAGPGLLRVVGRWEIVGLSVNDVIGSGIYLLPAAAAALLGPFSVLAVLFAGLAVGLLVLCYAQAASYFDEPGGSYLYARKAFGDLAGFEVGWMTWLTRVAAAAAVSNGLVQAIAHFWPAAGHGVGRGLVLTGSLAFLTWINVIGVRAAARTGVVLVIAKMLPLAYFIVIGALFVDLDRITTATPPPAAAQMAEAALLLLFAYAGFENAPAAAGEYKNPKRDVPFALLAMIAIVTAVYVAVQWVALGTLPHLAASGSPLAEAAGRFSGAWAVLMMTAGAAVSILGNNHNTMLFGPRYLYALAADGYGPAALARVHPRWHTPHVAVLFQGVLALVLALTGTFVQLALLSTVTRLVAYLSTAAAVIVLQRKYAARPGAFQLPGGPAIPLAAIGVTLGLLGSASRNHLVAAAIALLFGAVLFRLRRGE